jgi:glycyl-tRNA synthetase alpha chain
MLDGLEITQFTYFQQCGGIDLDPMCAELTYGLERIAAFLQDVDSIYDIVWVRGPQGDVTYGDIRLADEVQFSVYNFEIAHIDKLRKHFDLYEEECRAIIDDVKVNIRSLKAEEGALSEGTRDALEEGGISAGLRVQRGPILAAYELCLKCSHIFNLLDARGAISVTERVGVIARVRNLAVAVARAWVHQQSAPKELAAVAAPAQAAPV